MLTPLTVISLTRFREVVPEGESGSLMLTRMLSCLERSINGAMVSSSSVLRGVGSVFNIERVLKRKQNSMSKNIGMTN
jgi:hypothetical protein